ncbi:C40 family peptidase [Azoarcus olearius]|uniref:C40 family peptidase n=1 Tax=Azoarcus sp. (strain BH72) TaxID=418699 RepID=UPI00080687DB|nr:C40 family peptidase [Azoarcus olearius]
MAQTPPYRRRRPGAGPGVAFLLAALVAACSSVPPPTESRLPPGPAARPAQPLFALDDPDHPQEIVMFALGLLDTGYRFGGRNPEAGLDCSGMVSYVVEQVSGQRLPHNAAQIAERTRPISPAELSPGDLVFFNTARRPHSHMGIYIGDGRFIHAPSSRGAVRIEKLSNAYFAPRFDGARTLIARD